MGLPPLPLYVCVRTYRLYTSSIPSWSCYVAAQSCVSIGRASYTTVFCTVGVGGKSPKTKTRWREEEATSSFPPLLLPSSSPPSSLWIPFLLPLLLLPLLQTTSDCRDFIVIYCGRGNFLGRRRRTKSTKQRKKGKESREEVGGGREGLRKGREEE